MIHQLIFAIPKLGILVKELLDYWINVHAVENASKISQIKKLSTVQEQMNQKGRLFGEVFRRYCRDIVGNTAQEIPNLRQYTLNLVRTIRFFPKLVDLIQSHVQYPHNLLYGLR